MNWYLKSFSDLNTTELYTILQRREEVFVVEQTCPYLDADGADDKALHLWADSDKESVVVYARIFLGESSNGYSRIGRVLTSQSVRRHGYGRELMLRAIEVCERYTPQLPIRVGAQVYLRAFYESFGFVAISDEYLEDDIPHIDMERR